jgi:hypothetical protein
VGHVLDAQIADHPAVTPWDQLQPVQRDDANRPLALQHREARHVVAPEELVDDRGDGRVGGNRDGGRRHGVPDCQRRQCPLERHLPGRDGVRPEEPESKPTATAKRSIFTGVAAEHVR